MEISESVLQMQSIVWLEKQPGVWPIRYNNMASFVPGVGRIKLPYGMQKGTPDIFVMLDGGHLFFIEMKRPGKRQSKEQKDFQKKSIDRGFGYYVSCNLSDTQKALTLERKKYGK
jgi:hypothetical protein